MTYLMQKLLGSNWETLPVALQTHYQTAGGTDTGCLDIEYPRYLQIYLNILHRMGALINRRGTQLPTLVKKTVEGDREYWRRTITYPNGETTDFTSFRIWLNGNTFIEFVNGWLGLQMSARVENSQIYCSGICFVLKLDRWHIPIPEWMALGHTTIHEQAIDDNTFSMDFRMTHPLFGEVFRYAGRFNTYTE